MRSPCGIGGRLGYLPPAWGNAACCRREGARILLNGRELTMNGCAASCRLGEGETAEIEIRF